RMFLRTPSPSKTFGGCQCPGSWACMESRSRFCTSRGLDQAGHSRARLTSPLMDAVFVVDTEYPTFESAWEDLTKLVETTGEPAQTFIEPLRFTLKGERGVKWLSESELSPTEIGWHFGGPVSVGLVNSLAQQSALLMEVGLSHQATAESVG